MAFLQGLEVSSYALCGGLVLTAGRIWACSGEEDVFENSIKRLHGKLQYLDINLKMELPEAT